MAKYGIKTTISLWILQIAAAGIMLQTLFFKFRAAPESVEIFSALGMEPYGRILIGILELIAALLLLSGKFSPSGAILTMCLMLGAMIAHITVLGIDELFFMALGTFVVAFIVVAIRRKELPLIGPTM